VTRSLRTSPFAVDLEGPVFEFPGPLTTHKLTTHDLPQYHLPPADRQRAVAGLDLPLIASATPWSTACCALNQTSAHGERCTWWRLRRLLLSTQSCAGTKPSFSRPSSSCRRDVACASSAFIIERLAYRPVRRASADAAHHGDRRLALPRERRHSCSDRTRFFSLARAPLRLHRPAGVRLRREITVIGGRFS